MNAFEGENHFQGQGISAAFRFQSCKHRQLLNFMPVSIPSELSYVKLTMFAGQALSGYTARLSHRSESAFAKLDKHSPCFTSGESEAQKASPDLA